MARILKRAAARRDLIEHFVFLGENASLAVGRRFIQSVNASLQTLVHMPGIGSARTFNNPRFAGVRMWPVRGYERYLILYRPAEDGIELLRVVHGTRDLARLFTSNL